MFNLRGVKSAYKGLLDVGAKTAKHMLDAESEHTNALIDELIELGAAGVLFTGGGEPFLHGNILDFIKRVKNAGLSCKVNTNGTLLEPALIDEIIKTGVDELKITIMAGSPEVFVRTHPGVRAETFTSLKDNLYYLSSQKKAFDVKKPIINLVLIVVSQNHDGISDFIEFAIHLRPDKVSFRPVDAVGDPGLAKVVPTRDQARRVRGRLINSGSRLESHGISHNIKYFLKVFNKQLDTTLLYHHISCYYGWIQPRIEVEGNVYACCRCYEPLGNIYQNSFREIWNGRPYRRFRESAMQINKRRSPVKGCQCNACPHHTANIKVYKALHPIKGRSRIIKRLVPADSVS